MTKRLNVHFFTGYVEWICRAEDLVLAEERTTEADRELIMEGKSIFFTGKLIFLADLGRKFYEWIFIKKKKQG